MRTRRVDQRAEPARLGEGIRVQEHEPRGCAGVLRSEIIPAYEPKVSVCLNHAHGRVASDDVLRRAVFGPVVPIARGVEPACIGHHALGA